MSSNKKSGDKAAPSYPALRQFFSAYLHQDFPEVFGSAVAAARAFLEDASASDRKQLQAEWKLWRPGLQDLSSAGLAAELRRLGAAWAPQSIQAVDELGKVLS